MSSTVDQQPVKCPVCGSDFVHMASVTVNAMGQITSITSGGTTTRKGAPSGRGSCVTIAFWCENGHTWCEELQFHKGNTIRTVWLIDHGDMSALPRD